jgi:hypothetical protein
MTPATTAPRTPNDEAAAHSRRCDPFSPEYDHEEACAETQRAILERRARAGRVEVPGLYAVAAS